MQGADEITSILLAILAHKSLAAFALGNRILRSNPPLPAYLAQTLAFALATPLGACLALVAPVSAAPALLGLSSGTFLFVGAVEVVGKELVVRKAGEPLLERLEKWGMLVFGWAAMALLAVWL